jgi:hypothetical protein
MSKRALAPPGHRRRKKVTVKIEFKPEQRRRSKLGIQGTLDQSTASEAQTPKSVSRRVQLGLFRSGDASQNEIGSVEALRAVNLKLLETMKWIKKTEFVCMKDGCYVEVEVWIRRKKGKRLDTKYLNRETLVLHEHPEEMPNHMHQLEGV